MMTRELSLRAMTCRRWAFCPASGASFNVNTDVAAISLLKPDNTAGDLLTRVRAIA